MVLGDGNVLEAFCSIGTEAEYKGKHSQGTVIIGSNNKINEFVTIHAALEPEEATFIGSDCYIMTKSHIGHDAMIEDGVTLSSLSIVGGHSVVMRGANIGLAAAIHQKRVVGHYAMIGMNSTVVKSIPPMVIAMGSPAKVARANTIGLTRKGYGKDVIACVEDYALYLAHNIDNPGVPWLIADDIQHWQKRVKALEAK